MKKTAKRTGLAALSVFSLILLGLATVAMATEDGRQTVENVCNRCHSHEPICLNLNRNEAWWHMTAMRMISNGAPLSEAQAKSAASFLAALQPGSKPVCK